MGKALAIKGHSTRGKEVIELLEMLGGSNINNLSGDNSSAYYINGHQNIIRGIDYIFGYEDMQFFSIEKFLEKYPYKVGDKVHIYVQNDDIDGRYDLEVAEITSMKWDPVRCKIAYEMKDINREFFKEEIKCKVDDNLIETTKVMRDKFAIKGHTTRGKEVIELLEMLGGINVHKHMGINDKTFYYINDTNGIYCDKTLWNNNRYTIFTLEEFLEKYPFKVSDIVRIPEYESEVRIDKMYWDGYEIQYEVFTDEVETYSAEELNQWNESKTKTNNTQESLLKKNSITISSLCYEDKEEIKCKVDDNSNKQSECKKCGLHFGLVQCFYKDCPHNTPKSYAVGLMDDKVNESEVNKEIVMNENKPLFKTGDVVKLKGCPDKNLFWIVMDVIKDGYIFNNGKKYSFDDQHHFEKSNREVINLQPDKIAYLSINNEKYADQIEIDLGDNYEYKFEMNKLYIVKKKPTYPKTYEECCDVLSMCYATLYNLRYHTYEHGYYEFTTSDKLCSLQDKLNILGKLIICRNAYWEIAGEELGLDKPWEPDFTNNDEVRYGIYTIANKVEKDFCGVGDVNTILTFPTEEMRDVFYDNFKNLIEQCKELL